jgi:hypothetical protein
VSDEVGGTKANGTKEMTMNVNTNTTSGNGTSDRLVVEVELHTERQGRGAMKAFVPGPGPAAVPAGRVPRISKLMALALSIEQRVRSGEFESYSRVAELGQVTRARITQILNLTNLAPDIVEEILFLPMVETGRDLFLLRDLQPIARELEWKRQRKLWRELCRRFGVDRTGG